MSTATAIQWTDATWNPVTGCTKVSPGCKHCYAETVAKRLWAKQYPLVATDEEGYSTDRRPRRFTDVQMHPDRLDKPLKWRKPRRVFVNSMSDLFHEDVPFEFIDRVFVIMNLAERHTFQVLTKRADRMRAYAVAPDRRYRLAKAWLALCAEAANDDPLRGPTRCDDDLAPLWPLPNVWLGVSVENQPTADERISLLLQTPAAVRFLSVEPLLGPVDLSPWLSCGPHGHLGPCALHRPNWIIVGGESGNGARPCDVSWIRSIVEQCRAAGVPCFVKQIGANVRDVNDGRFAPSAFEDEDPFAWPDPTEIEHNPNGFREEYQGAPVRALLRDRKGGDMSEWPEDLRVRQFPS